MSAITWSDALEDLILLDEACCRLGGTKSSAKSASKKKMHKMGIALAALLLDKYKLRVSGGVFGKEGRTDGMWFFSCGEDVEMYKPKAKQLEEVLADYAQGQGSSTSSSVSPQDKNDKSNDKDDDKEEGGEGKEGTDTSMHNNNRDNIENTGDKDENNDGNKRENSNETKEAATKETEKPAEDAPLTRLIKDIQQCIYKKGMKKLQNMCSSSESRVKVVQTEKRGKTLFAVADIPKDTCLGTYHGYFKAGWEVTNEHYNGNIGGGNHLNGLEYVDPTNGETEPCIEWANSVLSRVNEPCPGQYPNLKWEMRHLKAPRMFTSRDVKADEELLIYYGEGYKDQRDYEIQEGLEFDQFGYLDDQM